jgi:hypothetical protein
MATSVVVLVSKLKSVMTLVLLPAIAVTAFYGVVGKGDGAGESSDVQGARTATVESVARRPGLIDNPPFADPHHLQVHWPANGTSYAPQSSDTIRGYASTPGGEIVIEAQDADGNWQYLGSTEASTIPVTLTAGIPYAFPWSFPAVLPSFLTEGGVLRLRVTVDGVNPVKDSLGFDADSANCLATNYVTTSWISAGYNCQALFPLLPGSEGVSLTVLSTARVPVDYYSPNNPNSPAYISLVQPVSSADNNSSGQAPLIGELYYDAIQAPLTLTEFRSAYGFKAWNAAPGPYTNGEIESTYYNKGDLGIGREMHCRRFSRKVPADLALAKQARPWPPLFVIERGLACYVKNYAKVVKDGEPGVYFGEDEDIVLDQTIAKTRENNFATVAMVQFDGSTRTDFIVYNGAGNLLPFAQLDKTGHNKAVPTNCLSCHGGTYLGNTTRGDFATNARFLPFESDDRVLKFSSTNPAFTKAAQATNIRNLNMLIHNFGMTKPEVKKHIKLMYGGNDAAAAPGPAYTEGYVPTSWQNSAESRKLYTEVVKPYCIGCHLSYPNPTVSGYDPFASYNDFVANASTILDYVCILHSMPNAEQTATNFWKSPARAYLLNHFGESTRACNPQPQ